MYIGHNPGTSQNLLELQSSNNKNIYLHLDLTIFHLTISLPEHEAKNAAKR